MAYIQQPTSKTLKKSNFSQNLTQLKTFLDSHYITRSYTEAVWKKKKKKNSPESSRLSAY